MKVKGSVEHSIGRLNPLSPVTRPGSALLYVKIRLDCHIGGDRFDALGGKLFDVIE
jgi:hypothetical protein